jgi:hypothetical protein
MLDLPEVPPGPVAWEDFMTLILEAIEARTPIQTENCDINETTTGFEIIPFAGGAPAAFAGTYKLYTVTASPTTGSTPLNAYLPIPGLDGNAIITIEHNANDYNLIMSHYNVNGPGSDVTFHNPSSGTVNLAYPFRVKAFSPAVPPSRVP